MPTMSTLDRSLNSFSSRLTSSPPKTRCSSGLLGWVDICGPQNSYVINLINLLVLPPYAFIGSTLCAAPDAAAVPLRPEAHVPARAGYRGCDPPQAWSLPRTLRAPKDRPPQGPSHGCCRPIERRRAGLAPPGQTAMRASVRAATP